MLFSIRDRPGIPFCCRSNKADHRKNTGGGYGNTFWLIEAVGLLENGGGECGCMGLLERDCPDESCKIMTAGN